MVFRAFPKRIKTGGRRNLSLALEFASGPGKPSQNLPQRHLPSLNLIKKRLDQLPGFHLILGHLLACLRPVPSTDKILVTTWRYRRRIANNSRG